MNLTAVILLISIMLPFCGLYALPPKKNTEILEGFAREATDDIADYVVSVGIKKIVLRAEPEKIAWLVANPLIAKLSEKNVAIFEYDSSGLNAEISVFVVKAEIVYEPYHDDDSLVRKVSFSAEGNLKYNGAITPIPDKKSFFSDIISRDDIDAVEDKNFSYARGIVPERDDWFYRNIIEPAIVVGTAAITIILLFTVRSQ